MASNDSRSRCRSGRSAPDTRRCLGTLLFTLGLIFATQTGFAEPAPLRADVLLAREGRVYLALADSGSVGLGDRLTLRSGKKTVAVAEVITLNDGILAVASVTSGSLAKTKKLSGLRVLREPRPIARPASLRVGVPSGGRSNLLIPCASVSIRVPSTESGARLDSLGARSYRLVRDAAKPSSALWPDTLFIRLFDEAGDEEIALERGELDAAVFWPGELSAHMRESPRWRLLRSVRSREEGLVLLTTVADQAAHGLHRRSSPSRRLQALDRDLLRGDLGVEPPLRGAELLGSLPDSSFAGEFTVDRSIPGRALIERLLNEPEKPGTRPTLVRYQVLYTEGPDEAARAVDRLFPAGSGTVAWYQPLSYPVVFRPELEPYVRALGAGSLADLVQCRRGAEAR